MTPRIFDFTGRRIHMIGIGGSSMSGLAQMLKENGFIVTGSDSVRSHAVERLEAMGIPVSIGHHPETIKDTALVVYSAAIHEDDRERQEAFKLDIPQMDRAVLLGQLMEDYQEKICISGTHGKTTTSAMIAQMLQDIGKNPTVHIGGQLDAIGGNTRIGGRDYFVAEACEFNRSFLHMPSTMTILLNIEEDHLDCYGDMKNVEAAYYQFLTMLPPQGLVIANCEDPRIQRLIETLPRRVVTFGLSKGDWTIHNLQEDQEGLPTFDACYKNEVQCRVRLSVAGKFNILHALCALAVAKELKLNLQQAADMLFLFKGAHRRFEHTGEIRGISMYHDYGHNPAEMRSAIAVAKLKRRRIIAVMQPHTFSRVITLFDDYLTCTQEADITLVTEIYAAREKDPGTVNATMLVEGMKEHGINAFLTPTFNDTERWILDHGQPDDLVITMGCGDINLLNEMMQQHWDESNRIDKTEEV